MYLLIGLLAWTVGAVLAGLALGAVTRRRDQQVERPNASDRPARLFRCRLAIGSAIRRRDEQLDAVARSTVHRSWALQIENRNRRADLGPHLARSDSSTHWSATRAERGR